MSSATVYSQLLGAGSVAFDVGAYVGERTDIFLALGCSRVIAIEAADRQSSRLKSKYAGNDRVIVLSKACGPHNGQGILMVHACRWPDGKPMDGALSTMSGEWLRGIDESSQRWNAEFDQPDWVRHSSEWSERQSVDIVTLDALIEQYGNPDFIKIDVEGFEREVIRGLSCPVRALSFEFNTLLKLEWAEEVIAHLLSLYSYRFNYILNDQLGEFALPFWVPRDDLLTRLRSKGMYGEHGDIFAKQQGLG